MVLGMYKVYRKIILACLLLIVASTVCGQRVTQTINDGWKFSLFEGDASTADFDVSGWTDVSIPHTWNSKDAEDEIPGYFQGKRLVQESRDSGGTGLQVKEFIFVLKEPIRRQMYL